LKFKIYLKSSVVSNSTQSNYPPIIDSRPKQSAFSTQTKPINQQSNFFQQQQQDKPDLFAERLRAMLLNENHLQDDLRSASINQLNSKNLLTNHNAISNRPQSSLAAFNYNPNNLMIHQQQSNDFNTQINDLRAQNLEAHEKLKQLQLENQEFLNTNQSNVSTDSMQKRNLLDKLKHEQQLLKDQINQLNKQRENAQQELEILSLNNTNNINNNQSSTSNCIMSNQNGPNIKSLKDFYNLSTTPNLSPI
jgi:hypothetical protein